MDRIQKILAARGLCSRRQAEALIQAGRVTCNGVVCSLGDTADPEKDLLAVDGKPVPVSSGLVYIMLNKPRGVVTTMSDEKGRRNVSELVADCPVRVYPVGRLDMDSEGLLLMTNDGDFANRLMHPKHQVDKVYRVWVRDYTPQSFEKLKLPVTLDGYQISPPKVKLIAITDSLTQIEVTIHEGRNRQVRRMCDIAGMSVKRLKRIREGSLSLGDLPVGQWRYLSNAEVNGLLK